MQSSVRQLVSNIAPASAVLRCYYRKFSTSKSIFDWEERDPALICPAWEEAIVREHRNPEISFDIMQKNTIDTIRSKEIGARWNRLNARFHDEKSTCK